MKRSLYLLLAVFSVLVAACVKEPVSVPDPADGGIPVPVTFNLDLGLALSKADAPASSALDDGSRVNKVFAAVFGSDGSLISTSRIGGTGYDATATMSGGKASVTITLSKGQEYKVVFFAQKDDTYTLSFADGNRATFSYGQGLKANDPDLDAFWAVVDVMPSVTSYNVTLKRPFAQVNVLVPAGNVPEGKTQFSSAMTVKAAPASFDLFAGKAGSDVRDLTFAESAIAAPAFGKYAPAGGVAAYQWVAMNFVLVPASGKVDLSFREKDMPGALELSGIPVKTNGRTNLVGALYAADEVDGTFNVWIDSGLSGGGEQKTDAEPTEITIADGSTYTAEKPLVIDAAGAPMTKVRLSVNGHSFSEVLAGADGGTITAESADPAVATAKVEGDEVVITPVGNGETVVTIYTPAYTKTDYQGGVFKLPVKVTGVEVVKKTPVISVTAPADGKLALEVGGTFSIKASVLDGQEAVEGLSINYASSDATVASVDKDGVVKALKAGEATLTLTTESNAGYEAAEPVTIAVTVKEAGGEEPGEVLSVTVAEFIAAQPSEVQKYQLTGEVTGKVNNTYGNFDLKDETGSVYVYGLTKTDLGYGAKNDQSFASLGIKEGDIVTLIGYRYTYKKEGQDDKVEVMYAYYVSHESGSGGGDDGVVTTTLTVSPADLSIKIGETGKITATTNSTASPTFTSDNPAIATVADDGTVTAVAEGTATITVAVAAVEGKFTDASKTVSVKVIKEGEDQSDILKVTVAEFIAAPASDKQKYELTGTISNIAKDKYDSSKQNAYGNFDLTDETGTVYVYGLTATEQGLKYDADNNFTGQANNDKSFASLGLKEGDTVTLIGYRYTYKTAGADDKIEVLGAYYVSHVPGGGSQTSYEPDIHRYEIPAISLKGSGKYDNTGSEYYGNANWYNFETTNSMQKVAMHTYTYEGETWCNYTTLVDGTRLAPLWTAFEMSADYPDENVGRNEGWTLDPAIPETWQQAGLKNAGTIGYSRGHFCASDYRQTAKSANQQTFYYTNQAPQQQNGFNGSIWSKLENAVKAATPRSSTEKLYVVVGVLYEGELTYYDSNQITNSEGRVVVSSKRVPKPSHFYKLVMKCTFDSSGKNMTDAQGTAYLFENIAYSKNALYSDYKTTIDEIEERTGFNFFANIPDNLEEQAENQSTLAL